MPIQFPAETELLQPVLALFGSSSYQVFLEARLSRKRIDLLLVPNGDRPWITVELKVKNWKKALWQAAINTQLSDCSYVALWHPTVRAALDKQSLFKSYGVGIISVSSGSAEVVLETRTSASSTRVRQQALILDELVGVKGKDEHLDTLSLLPA
jgi:hypothetical protein